MSSLTALRGEHLNFNTNWSSFEDQRKCGTVSILLTTTTLTLHCMFCEFYSDTLENFLKHLKNQHFEELSIDTSLWSEAPINQLQIKQEELEIIETKIEDDNSTQENAVYPLIAEKENLKSCAVKCELNESLHRDEPDDPDTQPNLYAGKPKFEQICRLIHYIHEHPTLWDTQLGVHYIRSERMCAFESITKQFLQEYPNLSIDTKYVQCKFKDLQSIYYNYNKNKTKPNKNYKKYFELLYFLKDHEKTKETKNLCKVCNKNVSCLPSHMQKHHCDNNTPNTKYLKCDSCEEMLPTAKCLQKHLRVIHRRFECRLCTRAPYTSSYNLRRHMENMHPEISLASRSSSTEHIKERICELCGRQLKSQNKLYRHIKTVHLQLRPYACPDCPRAFKQLEKLKSHKNSTHLNNREHVCDVCSNAFFDRKTLLQHKRLHSDVMNYICRVCSKTFRQAPALHSHMKTHQ